MKRSPRVLIVDDDAEIATMLSRALSRRGFRVDTTASPEDAIARAESNAYDAALLDLVMPERNGADLAGELRRKFPGLPIALLTGYANSPLIPAERSGITVFAKPVVVQEVVDFLLAQIG